VSVAVDPTTNTIFAVDRVYPQDGTLSMVNGATNAVTKVTVGLNPWDGAVDPTTGTAYVANAYDNDVSVVSESSGTVTGTIGVGSGPFGVAVDPDTGTLYVANAGDNTVSVVDEATQTVTATVNVGAFPNRLAVDPATDTVYVVNEEGDTVSVIDGTTTSTLSTPGVSAVGVNPAAGTLLVAGNSEVQGGSSLSIIDEATDNVIASLSPYTQAATAVTANPVTGEIYVAFGGGGGDGFLGVVTPVVTPGAPAGISASPGDGLATLTITPPANDGGSQIEYDTVTYTDSTNPANSGQVIVDPTNPVTIYNLTNRDSYTFTATATNLAGTGPSSGSSNAVIPVAPLTIGTTSLPGAPLGQNYSQTISIGGGLPPFSYSITSGSLPAGLGLDPDSGVISGTPSGPAGTSSFTVGVSDANSPPASASQQLSIQTGTLPKITIRSSRNPAFYGHSGDGNHAASTSAVFTEVVNGSAVARTGRQAANGHVLRGLAWRLIQ
jgi:YVTN family beta-propeller protein